MLDVRTCHSRDCYGPAMHRLFFISISCTHDAHPAMLDRYKPVTETSANIAKMTLAPRSDPPVILCVGLQDLAAATLKRITQKGTTQQSFSTASTPQSVLYSDYLAVTGEMVAMYDRDSAYDLFRKAIMHVRGPNDAATSAKPVATTTACLESETPDSPLIRIGQSVWNAKAVGSVSAFVLRTCKQDEATCLNTYRRPYPIQPRCQSAVGNGWLRRRGRSGPVRAIRASRVFCSPRPVRLDTMYGGEQSRLG